MKSCFGAFIGPVADRTRTGREPVRKRAVTLNQLVRVIGVFYATEMDLGGEVRKSYTMQATSKDTEQSITSEVSGGAKGGLFKVSAEASLGVTTRSSNKNAAMNTEWSAKGGDAAVWLSQDIDDDDVANKQAQWAKTIDNTNFYQFDFELKPMWDLVKAVDLKKGEEFQDYLEKKWRLQGEEFSPSMFVGEFIIVRIAQITKSIIFEPPTCVTANHTRFFLSFIHQR